MHVEPGRLDLDRFERWTHDAAQALDRADAESASELLTLALELWRGAPLADLTYESFAQTAIARLDELRLSALEQRFTAELELGRHAQVLAELEALVWNSSTPRASARALDARALPGGRQAEALDIYKKTRKLWSPSSGSSRRRLRELEHRVLTQDPSLDLERQPRYRPSSPNARYSSCLRPTIGSRRCSRSQSRSWHFQVGC